MKIDPHVARPEVDPDDLAKENLKKASQGLEAYFLRQMMSEVRAGTDGGLLDGGFAGATFHDMLDSALADSMAKAGGIGLGKMIEKQLDPGPLKKKE